jgi:hypothetical protein
MVQGNNITRISSTTTLSDINDIYLVNGGTTGFTITLPTITTDGINYKLIRQDNSTNTVTIQGTGSNFIFRNLGVSGTTGSGSTGNYNLNPYDIAEFNSYQNNWHLTTTSDLTNLPNYVHATRGLTGSAFIAIGTGTTGTNVPLDLINAQFPPGTWATGGGTGFTGGIIVPGTGTYEMDYFILCGSTGTVSLLASVIIETCLLLNSTRGITGTHVLNIMPQGNHTITFSCSSVNSFNTGDRINLMIKASVLSITVVPSTTPSLLLPSVYPPLTVASIRLNQLR